MAIVRDGDTIVIDVDTRTLDVEICAERRSRSGWRRGRCPPPRYTTGVFAKYMKLVSSASQGQ